MSHSAKEKEENKTRRNGENDFVSRDRVQIVRRWRHWSWKMPSALHCPYWGSDEERAEGNQDKSLVIILKELKEGKQEMGKKKRLSEAGL